MKTEKQIREEINRLKELKESHGFNNDALVSVRLDVKIKALEWVTEN